MIKLLEQMAKEYQIVSYHNFTHAFSVQLVFFFVRFLDALSADREFAEVEGVL